MSYISRHRSDLGGITDVLTAAQAVVTDPCLQEVTGLVGQLHELEQEPSTPTTPVQGIGLCRAVTPLRAVVWVRQRPWIIPVAAITVIGGLIGVGFLIGSDSKRSRSTVVTNGRRVNPSRRRTR